MHCSQKVWVKHSPKNEKEKKSLHYIEINLNFPQTCTDVFLSTRSAYHYDKCSMQLDTNSVWRDGRATCCKLNSQAKEHISFTFSKNSNTFPLVLSATACTTVYKRFYMYTHTYATVGSLKELSSHQKSTV